MRVKLLPLPISRRAENQMVKQDKTPRPGSVPYAAAKLRCTPPVVYELCRTGKLRHYRIAMRSGSRGDIRISDEAIADCIAQLERESAQQVH
jgi:hypothetical protein